MFFLVGLTSVTVVVLILNVKDVNKTIEERTTKNEADRMGVQVNNTKRKNTSRSAAVASDLPHRVVRGRNQNIVDPFERHSFVPRHFPYLSTNQDGEKSAC
jgi:hypothetical protein